MAKKITNTINDTLLDKVDLKKERKDITELENELENIHSVKKEKRDQEKLIRTSIFIPEKILKKFKIYCIDNNTSLKELLTLTIVEKANTI